MHKKFSVRLSEEAAAQLAELAKAIIVRQALARSLEGNVERGEGVPSSQAGDALNDRLERIEQGLKTLSEITALHARYHLAMTPHLDEAEHRAACQRGQERFEVFAQQVKQRVDRDTPLVDETICRVRAKQDAIAEVQKKMEAALGLPSENSEEFAPFSLAGNAEPAAAPEATARAGFATNGAPLPDFLVRSSEISRQPSPNRLAPALNLGKVSKLD
jgi:hypothetical protein